MSDEILRDFRESVRWYSKELELARKEIKNLTQTVESLHAIIERKEQEVSYIKKWWSTLLDRHQPKAGGQIVLPNAADIIDDYKQELSELREKLKNLEARKVEK
jgi:hypothetical protein